MKKSISILVLILLIVSSCTKIKDKTKSTINKGGEAVGKTATEFFEGVSEGVGKTLECDISLSENLIEKGLKTGKFSIENAESGSNNQLTLYIIFDQDFKSELFVKAHDKTDLEIGRTKLEVEGKAGDAGYYDFVFDERTTIEVRSKITIE